MRKLRDWFYRKNPKPIITRWLHMDGVTFPPFGIFIKECFSTDKRLAAHEQGHWEQFVEVGFWRFHWWWIGDYTWRSWGRQNSDSIEVDADRRADEIMKRGRSDG
jgi:hypothetical protein